MPLKLLLAALFAVFLSSAALAQDIPPLPVDEALRARLPEAIRAAGAMTTVNSGSFPPYVIVTGTEVTGASADLSEALGQLLGIRIEHVSVAGLPALLTGVKSGRYHFALGPVGDYPERQKANDFVDWVREQVVFAVAKGNPRGIASLDGTCGKRIAVMSGGAAEKIIKTHSETCTSRNREPVEVQSFGDQPTSIIAVRSKRSDAFFSSQAALAYFVEKSNGELELAGVGQSNGFSEIYQGAVVAKGSPLGGVLRDAFKILMTNGTYARAMRKWRLEGNMIKEPGINLGQ